MPIRRLYLPLILHIRAVLAVMLLQPPREWSGGYGRHREVEWTYKCTICDYEITLPSQSHDRARPFCGNNREHGRLDLVEWD